MRPPRPGIGGGRRQQAPVTVSPCFPSLLSSYPPSPPPPPPAGKGLAFGFLREVITAFEPLVPRARSAIAYSLGREFAPNLRRLMVRLARGGDKKGPPRREPQPSLCPSPL